MKFASAYSTCDDATFFAARDRAIGFIQYNHAHPSPPSVPTCDVATHQAKMKPKKRNTFVTVHVQKPVLLAKDTKQIFDDSGQQVTARCREHNGAKKLLSKAPLDCDELP